MAIKIYNTLSGTKENLSAPAKGKPVRLFVCGPTVWNYLHIGNARTYIVFDSFAKFLRSQDVKTFYLQNITDIDDKIINQAVAEHTTPALVAKKYQKIFMNNMKNLNVTAVDKYAPATKFIKEIIKQVKTLITKDYAYKINNDGYYFDLKKFPDYGQLARRTIEQAEDGVTRIDQSVNKRNAGDFCLWKFPKPGEPTWKADFGAGRPGWHIEDTAISEKFFGPQYDIHGGGADLKFPHHEAEIAQQESASGTKPMVKIWMHVGLLTFSGKKMSKSLGNFITIKEFLKNYPAEALRFLALGNHYRSPLDYSEENILAAVQALNSIKEFIIKLELVSSVKNRPIKKASMIPLLEKSETAFTAALADDFNTPEALAALFNFINEANKSLWKVGFNEAKMINKWLADKMSIFGIKLKIAKIPSKIAKLSKKRELFRIHKQFAESDALRKEIDALGYKVEDTPLGPLVLKVKSEI